jgi:hypothetical protein
MRLATNLAAWYGNAATRESSLLLGRHLVRIVEVAFAGRSRPSRCGQP